MGKSKITTKDYLVFLISYFDFLISYFSYKKKSLFYKSIGYKKTFQKIGKIGNRANFRKWE